MADVRYTEENSTQKTVDEIVSDRMNLILTKMISDLKNALKVVSKDSVSSVNDLYKELDKLEEQHSKKKLDLFLQGTKTQQKLLDVQHKFEQNALKEATSKERIAIYANQEARIKGAQEEYKEHSKKLEKLELERELWAAKSAERDAETRAAATEEEKKAIQEKHEAEKKAIEDKIKSEQEFLDLRKEGYEKSAEKLKDIQKARAFEAANSGDASDRAASKDAMKAQLKENPEDVQAREALSKLTQKDFQEAEKHREEQKDEAARERREQIKYRASQLKAVLDIKKDAEKGWSALGNLASASFDAMMKAIEEPISTFFELQAKYEARLQDGTWNLNKYGDFLSSVNTHIGASPFIKQRDMVKNLQTLIDKGINYNVELRAYLATVSESIASTFDAFDSNLLRLIRIQQNDSTAARLGIEAALTKFFNNMYSDTSYLGEGGSGIADQVSAALLDASAQLTHQGAAEMEFVAQKWLGSLYSLGVSGEAVQSIAQGLGYLGSGNIETLSGSENLMSLLAMSASRGGTSISDILTGGLTANTTNKLLQGMVTYLAEIANNTDANNVTKSSIAQVFGLTNTDLRSISNLTATDIKNIASTNMNYEGALSEASSQLMQIATRTHISQILNNVMDNAKVGAALTIGGSPALYGMAKVLNLITDLVGTGMDIPGIQAMGTGLSSPINILAVAKAALVGGSLLSTLVGSLNSLAGGGVPRLSSWKGYEQALSRGSGLQLQPKGVQAGFSESAQYNSRGSGSTDDIGAASMESSRQSAKDNQSEEDKESQDKAEKCYENVDRIRELIEDLTIAKQALSVSLNNNYDKPLPVVVTTPKDSTGTNSSMAMSLTDITDKASEKLNAAFRAIILSAFADETINSETGESTPSLATQIAEAMKGLNVHIDNDWFDEANQKSAFGGI